MTEPTATRRQERGRRRIEEILDAADAVFAEVGYEAATTNLIAARAGISPGSLYQYFANKPAIAEALADRYVRLLGEIDGGVLDPSVTALPLEEMVDRVIDPLLAFHLAHPGAKTLVGSERSPELTEATKELHDVLCGRVEVLIAGRAPALAKRDRTLAATVTIQIYAALLPAVMTATRRDRPRVVRELKAALTGYWRSLEVAGGA